VQQRNLPFLIVSTIPLLGIASWLFAAADRPGPNLPPRISGSKQLTFDGLAKSSLATDGTDLYFTELSGENSIIAKVPAVGGDISKFEVNFPNAELLDVSEAHSTLLAADYSSASSSGYRFWVYALHGGAAQRLGDLTGHEAVWSPDGRQVLLLKGPTLYVADGKGNPEKELVTVKGTPYYPKFSPDGKRVRFSVGETQSNTSTIWEVNTDGTGLHEWLPNWKEVSSKCCGNWSKDGRYYFFQAASNSSADTGDLYAVSETIGRTDKKKAEPPVKLTQGSISFSRPVFAANNKTMWTLGLNTRVAVVSYDPGSGKYVPFLSGISATDLDFSADGQWVAFVSVPEGTLWRCKIDGSERRQLTSSGSRAALPRWSPDGKRIAYVKVQPGKPWAIRMVPAEGGASEALIEEPMTQVDINWNREGDQIIFGRVTQHSSEGLSILSYDLKSHTVTVVPGSEGLFSPRLSPDGRYIAALSGDLTKLMLYDTASKNWSRWQTLESGALSYPIWAPDSKSIYFEDLVSGEGAYCRANVGESHYEHVFLQKGIERYLGPFGLWSGRAPNGSVLFVREASTREIYELQVELP